MNGGGPTSLFPPRVYEEEPPAESAEWESGNGYPAYGFAGIFIEGMLWCVESEDGTLDEGPMAEMDDEVDGLAPESADNVLDCNGANKWRCRPDRVVTTEGPPTLSLGSPRVCVEEEGYCRWRVANDGSVMDDVRIGLDGSPRAGANAAARAGADSLDGLIVVVGF